MLSSHRSCILVSLLRLFVTICIGVSCFIYLYTIDRMRLLRVIITPWFPVVFCRLVPVVFCRLVPVIFCRLVPVLPKVRCRDSNELQATTILNRLVRPSRRRPPTPRSVKSPTGCRRTNQSRLFPARKSKTAAFSIGRTKFRISIPAADLQCFEPGFVELNWRDFKLDLIKKSL